MDSDSKDNLAVVIAIVLIIAIIAAVAIGAWYVIANNLVVDLIVWVAIIIAALVAISIIVYLVFGTYYAVKKKHVNYEDSGATLNDIQEVDREMSKDDKH